MALEEAIAQIHDGAIGEVDHRLGVPRPRARRDFSRRRPGMSELAHQIRNYSNFTWLNGSFMLDWMIHNLDVCCWAKGAWPVSAQGQGGRQVRTEPDQLFDHYAVEYTFADGTRLMAQGRHIADYLGLLRRRGPRDQGLGPCSAKGSADPRIYKGYTADARGLDLGPQGGPDGNPYQFEHDLLFEAIRQDKPYNETERCAKAAMVGILGRMAAESGKRSPGSRPWPRSSSCAGPGPVHDGSRRRSCRTPTAIIPSPCREPRRRFRQKEQP